MTPGSALDDPLRPLPPADGRTGGTGCPGGEGAGHGGRPAAEEFAEFVRRNTRPLGRLAYFLVGDDHAAEDLVADVLLAAWRQWHQVAAADHPLAYLRRIMVNKAATRYRGTVREREGLSLLEQDAPVSTDGPDSAAVVDVRTALSRLPAGRRACLVLRYAFDLPEREVADTLGISVGTVKSQTAKAVAQFRRELGDGAETRLPEPPHDTRRPRGEDRR